MGVCHGQPRGNEGRGSACKSSQPAMYLKLTTARMSAEDKARFDLPSAAGTKRRTSDVVDEAAAFVMSAAEIVTSHGDSEPPSREHKRRRASTQKGGDDRGALGVVAVVDVPRVEVVASHGTPKRHVRDGKPRSVSSDQQCGEASCPATHTASPLGVTADSQLPPTSRQQARRRQPSMHATFSTVPHEGPIATTTSTEKVWLNPAPHRCGRAIFSRAIRPPVVLARESEIACAFHLWHVLRPKPTETCRLLLSRVFAPRPRRRLRRYPTVPPRCTCDGERRQRTNTQGALRSIAILLHHHLAGATMVL